MTGLIPIAVGLLAIKKLFGQQVKYPHTMYDCTTGKSVEVATVAEHDDYAAGGWVHSFDKCPLDSPFGRDYGEYDYDDSVDDLSDVQRKWTVVYQDDAVLDDVAVYKKEKLSYDPARQRRGYYSVIGYFIGSTDLWANGAPTQVNEKSFGTEQEAIDYYISIGKTRPTNPSKPEGEPMPEPEVGPVSPNEPTPDEPEDTPLDPELDPVFPSGGFGQGGYNDGMSYGGMPNTNFGGGY